MRWSAIGQRHPRYGYCVFGDTEESFALELGERGVCPYGKPGDRLWVRESTEAFTSPCGAAILARYRADREPVTYGAELDGESFEAVAHWSYFREVCPSIHMLRTQCRILLDITDVRVERLQSISEKQSRAEGISPLPCGRFHCGHEEQGEVTSKSAITALAWLWSSINGEGGWAANPWVWVVEFNRVMPGGTAA